MIEQTIEKEAHFDSPLFSFDLPKPVLIVEDDSIIQNRLKKLLIDLNYNNEDLIFSNTLDQSIASVKAKKIAFALVDLGLPDGNGTKLIRTLRQKNPTVPILVISAWSTREAIFKAIQAGATGYLLKERDDFEVLMSIKQILKGGIPIDPFLAQIILTNMVKKPQKIKNSPENLSARELEILDYVTQGFNNQDIANELGLSRYTVEAHLRNIYSKLAVDSRSKAIKIAYSLGLF
ncbi:MULTISPECIES: response regulator [Acinetobacter]|jgi:DNA-binding NarL/FixJ family response regulator|nr:MULTISPECIES: response regulator transcription factor [Acinetobacter]OJU79616.1 MAG: DNA-binding response regulator [Acinetobacter sp. 39-4]OJU97602.1 MAG: DNA-binding response regulator [Acinetobacter sp. 38-8]KKW78578.1 LuxR family transcriptional regulator [Acinetobacter sp. AG1]MCH7330311.1 response regulator transcription factor [Acinetobacter modestus]GGA17246.1 DNA-binding response regulator [Acinetobacter modestus]